MNPDSTTNGIHAMIPRDQMTESARRLRDTYARVPGTPLFRREFWLMETTLQKWTDDEGMPAIADHEELFQLDEPGHHELGQLGWTEAAFQPEFSEKFIEDRGTTEVLRDFAGRHVLYFKGRRVGFMPSYVDHPVKDLKTWEEEVKWRLDPTSKERFSDLDSRMASAREAAARGLMISQNLIGGYMYLRSLIDTDGFANPVIPLYRELGMDVMSPFEVASGSDVVAIGAEFPWLALFGGIHKRILAESTDAIDRELERVLPAMRERGGFIPTVDHGVPEETPYENYLHYRKRCVELGG